MQEEHSAFPAGVVNKYEDTDDENALAGGEKEIKMEMQQLRVVQHWINQNGWDHTSEQKAVSTSTGKEVDLRLDWDDVKRKLAPGVEGGQSTKASTLDKGVVDADYALDALDPTQRAFADRVLRWGDELVKTFQLIERDGKPRPVPKIRSWLCGSAGSAKELTSERHVTR